MSQIYSVCGFLTIAIWPALSWNWEIKKMELDTIKDAFDRVAKRQKLSSCESQQVIDKFSFEIEQALSKIQSVDNPMSPSDLQSIISGLKHKLDDLAPLHHLEASLKEHNSNLTKYPKVLDKSFNPDLSKAYRNVDFNFHIVNQIIASHFYRQGLFDLGDCLINEAGETEAMSLRSHFLEMHQVLQALKIKNLEPALSWIATNREKLKENASTLEFKLHRLRFLELVQKGNRMDAVNYAKTYLAPFSSQHLDEFRILMGCLLWLGRLESSPRAELLSPIHWERYFEELTQQFCSLAGQSYHSPLTIAIAAGVDGLPTLLKLAAKTKEWEKRDDLPVLVELGREFQFHSIFVCPVSRDQGREGNPPMLMPCLHVFCKESIMKLSKGSSRPFKCPSCPAEVSAAHCRQLHF